jgi:hypothetical protein
MGLEAPGRQSDPMPPLGGHHFVFAGCPSALARPSVAEPEGGYGMTTRSGACGGE